MASKIISEIASYITTFYSIVLAIKYRKLCFQGQGVSKTFIPFQMNFNFDFNIFMHKIFQETYLNKPCEFVGK